MVFQTQKKHYQFNHSNLQTKRKRDVKPITDPSQEGIAAQQSGLKKENSFESGSHSA